MEISEGYNQFVVEQAQLMLYVIMGAIALLCVTLVFVAVRRMFRR
jgi:hypothetical protein